MELSVPVPRPGFIRSEATIYARASVIYRFRWRTRYRCTDIDTFSCLESFASFPLCLFLSFPPAVYALRRYNRRLFLVLRETSISNFVGASRSKLLRPLKRPPLREKSSVYFFYDRLMPRAGGAALKEEKMRPITRSERGAVLGTGAAVCRAIINSGKSISSKRLLPKPRL